VKDEPGRPFRSRVAVQRCEDYEPERVKEAVRAAVALCLEGRSLELGEGSVLVKPNVLAPRPPEDGVCTHPAVVSAVLAVLREAGATELVVGDSSGGTGVRPDVTDRSLEASGIAEAAAAAGARVVAFDREEPVLVPNPRGPGEAPLALSRVAVEAGCLVSLPKLKTHTLTLLTGAVKNLFGTVPGGAKREYHRRNPSVESFSNLLLDIVELLKPVLHVVDAVEAMQGSGPSAGSVRRVGLIVAGTDPVAVDAVLAAVMGVGPAEVPTTRLGAARGLGEADLDRIEVVGVPLSEARVPGFRLPPGTRLISRLPPGLTRWAVSLATTRPAFIAGRCTGCGQCVKNCPVDALRLTGGVPELSSEKCIGCFCCHELCPSQAVSIRYRHPLTNLLLRPDRGAPFRSTGTGRRRHRT